MRSSWPYRQVLADMEDNPRRAADAIADFVRIVLHEQTVVTPGVDVGTPAEVAPPGGDLFCTVEGRIPIYRSDFAGEGDAREKIRDRVIDLTPFRKLRPWNREARRLRQRKAEAAAAPDMGPPGPVRVVHHDDIRFTVLARLAPGGAACRFQCHEITSAGATGEPGDPRWYGEQDAAFDTESRPGLEWHDARVDPYLSGDVKWDGCSNWAFYADPDGVMLHFCGRARANHLGILIDRCHDLALEMMGPGVVHDVAMFNRGSVGITDDPVAVELARVTEAFRVALKGHVFGTPTPEALEEYREECLAAARSFFKDGFEVVGRTDDRIQLRVTLPPTCIGEHAPGGES